MENNIFRLSAVLINDSTTKRSESVVRLINYTFIDAKNSLLTIKRIKQRIKKDFAINFSYDELENVLESSNYEPFGSNAELQYRMTNEYFLICQKKAQEYVLEELVSEYYESVLTKTKTISKENFMNLINTFLYDVYNSEIARISALFELQISFTPSSALTNDEINIINGFLEWDNINKNKMIYGLATLALEYCMLTSNTDLEQLKIVFQKKKFYIDTNILVAMLGLNGYAKFQQIFFLFEKLKSKNVSLFIGRNVLDEFESFLNKRVKSIINFLNGGNIVDPSLVDGHIDQGVYGVYTAYYKWVQTKGVINLNLFTNDVRSSVAKFIDEYNLSIDEEAIIENYIDTEEYLIETESLSKWKDINEESSSYSIIQTDVVSVLHLSKLRGQSRRDLANEIYFLLSTDGQLIDWRYSTVREKVALLTKPSIWANIILRFDSRTTDDYRSFSNFLMKASKYQTPLDIDKARLILNVIAEYTTVISEKKELIEIIVSKYSTDMINKKTEQEIEVQVRQDIDQTHAVMVDKKIAGLTSRYEKQIVDLQKQSDNINQTLDKQRDNYKELKDKVLNIEVDNQDLKKLNQNLSIKNQQLYKFVRVVLSVIGSALIIFSIILYLVELISYDISLTHIRQLINHIIDESRVTYYSISTLPIIGGFFLITKGVKNAKKALIIK